MPCYKDKLQQPLQAVKKDYFITPKFKPLKLYPNHDKLTEI